MGKIKRKFGFFMSSLPFIPLSRLPNESTKVFEKFSNKKEWSYQKHLAMLSIHILTHNTISTLRFVFNKKKVTPQEGQLR